MRTFFVSIFFACVFVSCAQQDKPAIQIPVAEGTKPSTGEAVATFAQGCFWHTEIVFQSLVGVRDAVSGYAGGATTNPTYESVSKGKTGHAESVQVFYDPAKISYKILVAAFFASQDPTTLNRQGNDVGTEYRSIAFYTNNTEKQVIQEEIERLNVSGKYRNKIVTEVVPFTTFHTGENYHQEYIAQNAGSSYVRNVSIPDFIKFRKEFNGPFKP